VLVNLLLNLNCIIMNNLFDENQFFDDSNDYPELQVVPAAAGAAVLYGVVAGVISSTITSCTEQE
jgi:hypothetical protein